jgi:chitin disaccharide deacetylase
MPRLIINADDFGLTSGVNRAIEEAGRAGRVTSATLMANARAFEEAVALAKKLPGLRIGCHIVLVDGEPITSGIPSLTDGTAIFKSSLKNFARAALREQISQAEIQREAAAQIGKIQSAGISLTHVDTHKHTHVFPHVLRPVLKAAKGCGIRAVRNPFEPIAAWPGALLGRPALWIRTFEAGLLSWFAHRFRETVAEEGMSTTGGTVGIIATGRMNQKLLLRTLRALPEGTWELVCHPGYADSDLRAAGTRLIEAREVELETLASEETREALTRRGVELISYGELS